MKTIKILFLTIDFLVEMFSCNAMNQTTLVTFKSGEHDQFIHNALSSGSTENFVTTAFSNLDLIDEWEEEDEQTDVYGKFVGDLQSKSSLEIWACEDVNKLASSLLSVKKIISV